MAKDKREKKAKPATPPSVDLAALITAQAGHHDNRTPAPETPASDPISESLAAPDKVTPESLDKPAQDAASGEPVGASEATTPAATHGDAGRSGPRRSTPERLERLPVNVTTRTRSAIEFLAKQDRRSFSFIASEHLKLLEGVAEKAGWKAGEAE